MNLKRYDSANSWTMFHLLRRHAADFSARNKCLTATVFSSRAIGIINFEKAFSKFYRRHYKLISKFNVGLKTLLREGLSEPEFYCDLVYKFKKLNEGMTSKTIIRYKRIGYNLNIMRQSACLVFNPIMVDKQYI